MTNFKKSISRFANSVESGEFLASSSEWKIGSDELFVTFLNDNSDKITKPIRNYLDLFINTNLNHKSIRSVIVSQPNKNFSSINGQLFNAMVLSPIWLNTLVLTKDIKRSITKFLK